MELTVPFDGGVVQVLLEPVDKKPGSLSAWAMRSDGASSRARGRRDAATPFTLTEGETHWLDLTLSSF